MPMELTRFNRIKTYLLVCLEIVRRSYCSTRDTWTRLTCGPRSYNETSRSKPSLNVIVETRLRPRVVSKNTPPVGYTGILPDAGALRTTFRRNRQMLQSKIPVRPRSTTTTIYGRSNTAGEAMN